MAFAKAGSVGQSKADVTVESSVSEGYTYVLETQVAQLAFVAEVALREGQYMLSDIGRYARGAEPLTEAELHSKVVEAMQCVTTGIAYLETLHALVHMDQKQADRNRDSGDGLYL